VGVVQQPIQEGAGGGVAEELAPVLDGAVRGDERGGPFIAPHDDLQQIFGRGDRPQTPYQRFFVTSFSTGWTRAAPDPRRPGGNTEIATPLLPSPPGGA
jgi:hypothetical protein